MFKISAGAGLSETRHGHQKYILEPVFESVPNPAIALTPEWCRAVDQTCIYQDHQEKKRIHCVLLCEYNPEFLWEATMYKHT